MSEKSENKFEDEMSLIMTVRGIFQIFLIIVGILLWIFSVLSEGLYLGSYLQHLMLPHWIQFWLIPIATFLIPLLGIFLPVVLFFYKEGTFKDNKILSRAPFKVLLDVFVLASMILLVISPIFLAVFITARFADHAQLIILATSLLITFVLIMRSVGILRWIKYFVITRFLRKHDKHNMK